MRDLASARVVAHHSAQTLRRADRNPVLPKAVFFLTGAPPKLFGTNAVR